MQESPSDLAAGQHIIVRDQPWAVLDIERFERIRLLRLRGLGAGNRGDERSVLSPFDILEPAPPHTAIRQRSRHAVLATVAATLADAAPWDQCWTAATAHIDLHAWQLEPAVAVLRGATRILLADHVGLGKTIQASLIVSELRARGLAERVLVLTPASLRGQWAGEMRERFGLSPTVFDPPTLNATIAGMPSGINPWHATPLIIASIDLVKRTEVRAALDGVGFDILVVDEAHHAVPGTDRAQVIAQLASRTPWVVLVTATPHCGEDAAFEFLQRLGAGGTEPLVTFRRSARHRVGHQARRSRLIGVQPSEAEHALLEAIAHYVRDIARAKHTPPGLALVASVIARRAASSAEAVRRTLARRLALLTRERPPEPQQTSLPWEEDDGADAELSDGLLAVAAAGDVRREIDTLKRLILLADDAAGGTWSKVAVIRRLLSRTHEQALVFSEFRDVALLAATALGDLTTIATIHGGLSSRERETLVADFNHGRVRTLVATDAAGEGLNLQARCRLVINLELPWTPRRLEQRIGRVDRLGQTRRVHALHLIHRGSFEGTVVARLERRRSQALQRTLTTAPTERATTTGVARRLRAMAARHLAHDPGPAVYASRRLRRTGGGGVSSVTTSTSTRLTPCAARRILVFSFALLDQEGKFVQRELVPLSLDASLFGSRPLLSRRLLRELVGDPAVQGVIEEQLAARLAPAQSVTRVAAAAFERRLSACLHSLEQPASALWQGSLFDRRAERHALLRQAQVQELRASLIRRQSTVAALNTLHAARPRLLAASIF